MPSGRRGGLRAGTIAPPLLASIFFGCAAGQDASRSRRAAADPGLPAASVVDARPAALIGGRVVTWGELRPALNDLAGGTALEEWILDQQLASRLEQAGIVIGERQTDRERAIVLGALSPDPDRAARLLLALRERAGLGEARFAALLWRNAALRALVAGEVRVTTEAIEQTFQMVHGPRRQGRVIVVAGLREAQQALEEVQEGALFAEVAARHSIDQSAARGGLLEPISRADARYPEALRQALWSLQPGEVSAPLLLDGQYALVMLVDEIPASGVSQDQVAAEINALARLQQERLAMERLSRALMADVSPVIFDEALQASWQRRRRQVDAGPLR
jgi:hypothetical protein